MKMNRGWALFFGIVFFVIGLWSLMQDLVFGVRHGFNAPIMTSISDQWHMNWKTSLAHQPHHVLMPLHDVMIRHLEGLLIGSVIITICWWLAWRERRIAQGERTPRPYSNIHIVNHKR